ncbi:YybH family protein [Fulvivirga lutea]|uniref:Nuclear transport factor 2 family protein n=1 Tax=Fulvivirga lutea TaxID=2810512 RepID=A0A974WJW1_9BACT|nr:nuclear transport factor 2 family protein [Fulvivirga lutea]QSE99143.1 nuclear transport factor 2 family protein [Fulvivirga lutea]
MKNLYLLIGLLIVLSCNDAEKQSEADFVQQIESVEKSFNDMAAKEGVKAAFLEFVAEDGVINRRGRVFQGKKEIEEYFDSQTLREVQLQWQPEFIDVSESGDMAYTYGQFTFSAKDTTGQSIESAGIFHTVWKRQKTGEWKFVYD